MVSTETRYGLDSLSLNPGKEKIFFLNLQKIPESLLLNGYQGSFPEVQWLAGV
jgi:hypothetical protein